MGGQDTQATVSLPLGVKIIRAGVKIPREILTPRVQVARGYLDPRGSSCPGVKIKGYSHFAYSHFAYSRFAYSHFAYSRFGYSQILNHSRFAYTWFLCHALPAFDGVIVKLAGRADFSDQFRKIIVRYKRIGYNINIMRQSACLVFNPITVNNFASLFNCTPVGRASDSMMAPT